MLECVCGFTCADNAARAWHTHLIRDPNHRHTLLASADHINLLEHVRALADDVLKLTSEHADCSAEAVPERRNRLPRSRTGPSLQRQHPYAEREQEDAKLDAAPRQRVPRPQNKALKGDSVLLARLRREELWNAPKSSSPVIVSPPSLNDQLIFATPPRKPRTIVVDTPEHVPHVKVSLGLDIGDELHGA